MKKKQPGTKNRYFDVAAIAGPELGIPIENAEHQVNRMREIGIARILYGSDGANGGNLPPREAWAAFRKLPLTDAEFHAIAKNVAPYCK